MNKQNSAFRPLFGHYFLELQRFLASLIGFKNNENGEPIRPVVLMGTPSAAFRNIITPQSNSNYVSERSFAGITNLPLINFIATDYRRQYAQENPYARLYTRNIDSKKTALATYSPQSWDISIQISIWTDTFKERDDMMSKLVTSFRHELNLPFYPDPINFPNDTLWMTFRMDESFIDETIQDDLQEKESRRFIKSSFNVICNTILPYDSNYVPLLEWIQLISAAKIPAYAKNLQRFTWRVKEVEGEEIVIFSNENL
jgi:hypothetical protein